MKSIICLFFVAGLLNLAACKPTDDSTMPDNNHSLAGYATGKVLDSQGKPLKGAEIVANNTGPYSNNEVGYTDASGNYKIKLPSGSIVGSFYIRGSIKVNYEGQTYVLGLFTENDGTFSAEEGGVKNLRLKLSGERTGNFGDEGYYGGRVEIDNWTRSVELSDVELTLTPVGSLVDGSTGKKLVVRPVGYSIRDIPVGKYVVTARQISLNKSLAIRISEKGQRYAQSATGTFEPIYAGSESCLLMVQLNDL